VTTTVAPPTVTALDWQAGRRQDGKPER